MTSSLDPSTLPYRSGVGVCLFNSQGQVLIAERRDRRGSWQMPQGGVQKGEDSAIAMFREMKEEIGTDNAVIIGKVSEKLTYEFPDWLQNRRMVQDGANGAVFRGKYRGQEQEWFALLFLGQDSDINLTGDHEPELPEFVAWRWVELDQVLAQIVPFKKPLYEKVAADFAPLAEILKKGQTPPAWKP